jgi:hypothetical protein
MIQTHELSKIIKAVMSSAAEAELGGLFINAKTAVLDMVERSSSTYLV